ncbi:NfeD family protein [Shinella yambaruensis]|uniref:Membrane protein n=1 Tax=Shinella yambaruensis TaxID=415996 RepID=A0ABQ5ZJ66_9HYPH|nr:MULTISPECIES: NfeD family protein [Shinella]CAI0339251.1 putative activity regulator of membrane protease YbbK [Rhizobiaceae bacterium]CAK7257662.1 inner membrane protein [Shinella sp. WSC3-e]MCJ8026898.1 NfeD family protein [Shinella yambaruensis]MCO5141409.1 NfeD family protein [Shinella sp.]MCU7982209.1 NfeD family protein [Shinella yambaruensis]
MIQRIVTELGPWAWWVLGIVLLILEVLMPGVFLVWIGIAAIVTGALSLLLWESAFWTWHVQWLLFAVLSLVAVVIGRRIVSARGPASDQPHLNQRGQSLVGRTATLEQPISEGRGRIRLDDTMWSVQGPDLPVGARVRVTASNGRDLIVEAV